MLPLLTDGVYNLLFRLKADTGPATSGLAIIRDNRIFGSDPEGSVFEGHLAPDEQGTPRIRGVLSLPPGGELITGLAAGPEGMDVELTAHPQAQDGTLRFIAVVAGESIDVDITYVGPLPLASAKPRSPRSK